MKLSLSARVLLGLGLGLATGLFFGEKVAFLHGVGRAFVVLLQMTVLPFVMTALIRSLGSLSIREAKALARNAGVALLVIWGLTLIVVVLFPLAFPSWQSASFFSSSLVEASPPFDPISLYLTSNPFRALSDGVVPAVVVFSMAVGLSLMATERKGALIEALAALEDTLQRVAGFVVSLAPYGVFAIAAHAAGTMHGDELLGLQVYAVTYVAIAVALAFWLLPVLVTSITPFSYGQVVGQARAALLTAFATGSVFVVLPLLSAHCRKLLEERDDTRESSGLVDVIVPIAFTLASAGKLLSLAFVLFAGWLSGFPVSLAKMPQFVATGLSSFFASTAVAIPFLLDVFHIPADAFQLFLIADSVVGSRFGSMLASVHILSLTLLGVCGAAGVVRLRAARVLRWAGVGAVLVLLPLGAIRLGFDSVEVPYKGYQAFVDRGLLLPAAPARELDHPPAAEAGTPALDRIRNRRSIRVGWIRDSLPLVFRNSASKLVGFDIEMANTLARDFDVQLELVETTADRAIEDLNRGVVDVLPGVPITPARLELLGFSDPYLELTLAFVVPDYRREEFSSFDSLSRLGPLRIGVPRAGYYVGKLARVLPTAKTVPLDSPRDYFRKGNEKLDALLTSAETGSAWTLIYPAFAVAVPQPGTLKAPVGYAVRRGESDLVALLDGWILLKKRDRTIERLFDYWFKGIAPPEARPPRWSIYHDVLGFGGS